MLKHSHAFLPTGSKLFIAGTELHEWTLQRRQEHNGCRECDCLDQYADGIQKVELREFASRGFRFLLLRKKDTYSTPHATQSSGKAY